MGKKLKILVGLLVAILVLLVSGGLSGRAYLRGQAIHLETPTPEVWRLPLAIADSPPHVADSPPHVADSPPDVVDHSTLAPVPDGVGDPPTPAVAIDVSELLQRMDKWTGAEARPRELSLSTTKYGWGQSPVHGQSIVIARSTTRLVQDVATQAAFLEVRNQAAYPYPFQLSWTETIRGDAGSIDGADTFLGDRHREMESARLALRLRELECGSPHTLARASFTDASGIEGVELGVLGERRVALIHGTWRQRPITLVVDDATAQPLQAQWQEDRPIDGDVRIAVRWEEWPAEGGEPQRRIWTSDGNVVQVDAVVTSDATSEIPELTHSAAVDAAELAYGLDRARFLGDWIGFGFPQGQLPFDHDLQFDTVAEGVSYVTGEFHNSVVVETDDDTLIVVEAPFSPERAEALLAGIAERWPGKEIEAVVNSHWHTDHSGGLRAFVARGIPIVAPAADVGRIEQLAANPKTVLPDSLAKNQRLPRIIEISDRRSFGSVRKVEVLSSPNLHAQDMLVVWLPGERILFNADLFNPGLFPTRGLAAPIGLLAIDSADPYTLKKAGAYAAELSRIVREAELPVREILGGHGPDTAEFAEIDRLIGYGDASVLAVH